MKEDDVELEMREHDREKEGEIEDDVELTGLGEEEVVPLKMGELDTEEVEEYMDGEMEEEKMDDSSHRQSSVVMTLTKL